MRSCTLAKVRLGKQNSFSPFVHRGCPLITSCAERAGGSQKSEVCQGVGPDKLTKKNMLDHLFLSMYNISLYYITLNLFYFPSAVLYYTWEVSLRAGTDFY